MKNSQWVVGMKSNTGKAVVCTAVGYLIVATFMSLVSNPFTNQSGPLSCPISVSNLSVGALIQEVSQDPSLTQLPVSEVTFQDQKISEVPPRREPVLSPPVLRLLDEIRQARAAAAESSDPSSSYGEEEKAAWERDNPCQARTELLSIYANRNVVQDAPPNPEWDLVFQEYSELHRTCMRKIDDIVDVFESKRSIPGCKFVTAESLFGLGNRITFSASIVLFAVLTKRIVLLPKGTTPSIMCEPFEGSWWTLDYKLEYLNRRASHHWVNERKDSNATVDFLAWTDEANGDLENVADKQFFHAEMDDGWHPVDRFFCNREQQFLAKAEWVSASGCLYFVPKLYAIPSFREVLEGLFPDPGLTLTYVLRSAFLPNDETWERVQRVYEMHLDGADRRVSIQSRYRWGHEQHDKMGPAVNKHISRCLQENGLLPNVSNWFTGRVGTPPFPVVKVMITSLYTDLHEHLTEIYLRHHTVTGESVGLIQLTHDKEQRFTKEVDTQALVEVLCLSLSDEILVTPLSTFGGVAQAYGALRPWLIEFNDKEEGSCSRSPSVDMCYQEAHEGLTCPYEPSLNGTSALDQVPYLQKCSTFETWRGVLLVSK